MVISINPAVSQLRESATLGINSQVKRLRGEGRDIVHFGFGQAAFPIPQRIQQALRENAHQNSYMPTQGYEELRKAVAQYYQTEFSMIYQPEDVFIGPGSKELIFQMIYLLEGVLLIPAPSWVSYGPQAALRGKRICPISTQREMNYKLQPQELEQACDGLEHQQKLLILNNPNNPTGAVYRSEELEALAQVCRRQNIVVISDEIYAKIDFFSGHHSSIATYYPEGTIVSGGLSKSFAAGGYRLGVMLIPQALSALKQGLLALMSETFSAVSAPVQHAAFVAYSQFGEFRQELEINTTIYAHASLYLHHRFVSMGLSCPEPEGAFYLFPDFENFRGKLENRGIHRGAKFTQMLLFEAGVAVLPASDFYFPDDHLGVRVACVDFDGLAVREAWPGESAMEESLTRLLFPRLAQGCDWLEEYLNLL